MYLTIGGINMVVGISVITCSLLYSIVLFVIYFSKERISNTENKIYSILVAINVLGLILELACTYFTYTYETTIFNNFMCILCNRLFIMYLLTWEFIFTLYMFFISFGNNTKYNINIEKNKKHIITPILILYLAILGISLLLPLYYHNSDGLVYSYGAATDLLVIVGGICIMFDIFCIIKNYKNVQRKKYVPLIILVVLLVAAITIRLINPGIVLINATFAFITFLMYFTVENPDVQMIRELYKNKKIIEKSNEDTSKFLFRITADLKNPIKELISVSNDIKSMKNKEEILEANKYIYDYANKLDYLVNKALNISNMDTQKIKVYDSKYNVYNLFNEINHIENEEIKDNIKFNYTIGSSLPTYLYGDAIKLKQVITSAIRISQSFTEEGFINLDISSLIKYDICRLIITIEDSGKGISIDRVNQILSMTNDDKQTINDDKNIDIFEIKKLVNILGGSLMIKSEENKGTSLTITLDQKIVPTKETEITKKLENYEQTLQGNKKVLLIDDDEKELAKITKWLEKEEIDVTSSMLGKDATERIRSKHKYDLIILDDELTDTTALAILQELQKFKNFKTPVIVMINDNKEGIKLHYLKDGFYDTISKSKLDTEIERILKRF